MKAKIDKSKCPFRGFEYLQGNILYPCHKNDSKVEDCDPTKPLPDNCPDNKEATNESQD